MPPGASTRIAPVVAPDPDRDPARLLLATQQRWRELQSEWGPQTDLWLFGYASLIWRPECDADEVRPARVFGWHRCLEMRSRVNRGTPERPGLVFALMRGGSCRGVAYRVAHSRAEAEIARLWDREMPTGVYDPRWLVAHTPEGTVPALAFTLSRESPAWVGKLARLELVDILTHARGRFGTTLDYLLETHRALNERGIRDHDIERQVRWARLAGLRVD